MKFKVVELREYHDIDIIEFREDNGLILDFSLGKRDRLSLNDTWSSGTSDTNVSIFDPEDFIRWVEKRDFQPPVSRSWNYTHDWLYEKIPDWWGEKIKERYNFEQGAIGLHDDNGNRIYSDSKVEYSLPNVDIVEVRVEPATDLPGDILYRVEGERSWRTMNYIGKRSGSLKVIRAHAYEED